MEETDFTPRHRAEFLSEQYARAERRYHELCDECGRLSKQLIETREKVDDQLSFMHIIGSELLEVMKEVR